MPSRNWKSKGKKPDPVLGISQEFEDSLTDFNSEIENLATHLETIMAVANQALETDLPSYDELTTDTVVGQLKELNSNVIKLTSTIAQAACMVVAPSLYADQLQTMVKTYFK